MLQCVYRMSLVFFFALQYWRVCGLRGSGAYISNLRSYLLPISFFRFSLASSSLCLVSLFFCPNDTSYYFSKICDPHLPVFNFFVHPMFSLRFMKRSCFFSSLVLLILSSVSSAFSPPILFFPQYFPFLELVFLSWSFSLILKLSHPSILLPE